jgi:hypothetical protein
MESNNLLIGHKHDKKIYMIERFVASDYGWKLSHICGYTRALDLTWVRKRIIFRSVTFQNLVHNSCNVWHVMHMMVDLPLKNLIDQVD